MALPWLIWGAAAALMSVAVISIVMSYISRRKIKERLSEKNNYKAVIREKLESSDYNAVHLDLYDNDGNKSKVEIKGEEIDQDVMEGDVIIL